MTLPASKPAALPVLLIEDEPAVMAYVRATLERNGYAVVCAESGVEGVRILESGAISRRGFRYAHPRRHRRC